MPYWNTTVNKIFLVTLFSSINILQSNAQENSPYSRYVLGNLKLIENVANRGMGGVAIADENPVVANPSNPATFAGLRLTSFQVGVEGNSVKISNDSVSNRTGSLALSYVNIGFALTKKMGFSFGLMPITRSKYGMQQSDSLPGISRVTYDYYGGGGIQQIYVGGAYKYKDYSIGVSTGYVFGHVVRSSEASFTDSLKLVSSSVSSRTNLGGVFFQLGGLMNQKVKEKYQVSIGATYRISQQLNARKETYWKSFIGDVVSPDFEYKVDSITGQRGKVVLPATLGMGIMISEGDIWKAGADFISSNWEKYRYYDQIDSTGKSWMLKLGASLTPDPNAIGQGWKRLTYRAGLYVGQDLLRFGNVNLPSRGLTVGLGLPIRRTNMSIGQINASLDIGKRGTTKNGLLNENYSRFTIGLTFNDKWFIPRKYD